MGQLKETILIKGVFPFADCFLHTGITSWYSRLEEMLQWGPDRIRAWQTEKMKKLVEDAYNFSTYYHGLFDSLSLKPEDIHSFDDLKRIPPLTKDIIREHYDGILLHGKEGLRYKSWSTGGSTGNPCRYVRDNNSWGFINAFNILMWKQTGYHYGDRFLALGSSSIFPTTHKSISHDLYYALKGKIPFNAMNMSQETMSSCVQLIQRKKIHYLYGYASSIFLLAKFIEENHLESSVDIRACFPTSEVLTNVYRETMERVFQCTVADVYGAYDGGMIANKIAGGYKVGYNCIVQTDETGEPGPAYLTDLTNNAFPFIRYQLGDELEIGDGYNSFFNGQVLNKVIGRTSDVIRLENGRVLTGPGFTILFSGLPVKGYRIYKSGFLQITLEIVNDSGFGKQHEELVLNTMHKHAGNDCDIVIRYSDEVRTKANGKNLYFLNDPGGSSPVA